MSYNVAFIGFGGMSGNHYKQLSKGNLNAKAYGVWDIDESRRKAAVDYGMIAYNSADELLSDKNVDIVVVAVPNHLHREYVKSALRAGKHVICEKPAAIYAWELEEMMAVAKETGKILTIDQNRRVNRDYVLMRRSIESGEIGNVYLIESRVEGSRGVPAGWRTSKEQGGGMMLDWGVHLIDQIMYMDKSAVTEVYCRMYSINYPEVDDNFHLRIRLESGLEAIIEIGTNHFIPHPRWIVYGKEGTLQIDGWDCTGKMVRCLTKEDTWSTEIAADKAGPSKTMAARSENSVKVTELTKPDDVNDTIEPTYLQLFDAIEGKAELTIKPEEALRVMKVMEAAFESAEKHQVIKTNI